MPSQSMLSGPVAKSRTRPKRSASAAELSQAYCPDFSMAKVMLFGSMRSSHSISGSSGSVSRLSA